MNTTIKLIVNEDQSVFMHRVPSDGGVWRDAIEVAPAPIPASNQTIAPTYDFSKTPIEISYTLIDMTVGERKPIEVRKITNKFSFDWNTHCIIEIADMSAPINITELQQAKTLANSKIIAINAATSHQDLDLLI